MGSHLLQRMTEAQEADLNARLETLAGVLQGWRPGEARDALVAIGMWRQVMLDELDSPEYYAFLAELAADPPQARLSLPCGWSVIDGGQVGGPFGRGALGGDAA